MQKNGDAFSKSSSILLLKREWTICSIKLHMSFDSAELTMFLLNWSPVQLIEGGEGKGILPICSHLPLFDSWIQKGLEWGFEYEGMGITVELSNTSTHAHSICTYWNELSLLADTISIKISRARSN